ncbi:MAG: ABC transporter ATP-binding protein [Caulobacteraceae bacterium]
MTTALELTGACVEIAGRPVLEQIDLRVEAGEVVGVVGANGSGKTTLVRAALGLARLAKGHAMLAGRPVRSLSERERARLAAYLPQERRIGWSLPAWRIAALGAHERPPAEARRRALEALSKVGMAALAERGALEMSGGERARVLIARLLVAGRPFLAADEPAAGLDPDAQILVMDLMREAADGGAAVLATLHDLTLAARSCDRLAVLAGGRLVSLGPPRQALTPAVLAAAFGLAGEVIETSLGLTLLARRQTPPQEGERLAGARYRDA